MFRNWKNFQIRTTQLEVTRLNFWDLSQLISTLKLSFNKSGICEKHMFYNWPLPWLFQQIDLSFLLPFFIRSYFSVEKDFWNHVELYPTVRLRNRYRGSWYHQTNPPFWVTFFPVILQLLDDEKGLLTRIHTFMMKAVSLSFSKSVSRNCQTNSLLWEFFLPLLYYLIVNQNYFLVKVCNTARLYIWISTIKAYQSFLVIKFRHPRIAFQIYRKSSKLFE